MRTTPKLYVFTISHYCEKARWALDYFAIPYNLKVISPLEHRNIAARLGLERGSVPFLEVGDEVIQGSASILAWAERNRQNSRSLHQDDPTVSELQTRFDDTLGVHVRRFYYSEGIVERPDLVKPIFLHKLSLWSQLKMQLAWPKVRELMTRFMNLGDSQREESQRILEAELDWLEDQLERNNGYLTQHEFSAADLTAVSLLAPLILPPEYPATPLMELPPKVELAVANWKQRRSYQWTREIYAAWRDV